MLLLLAWLSLVRLSLACNPPKTLITLILCTYNAFCFAVQKHERLSIAAAAVSCVGALILMLHVLQISALTCIYFTLAVGPFSHSSIFL